MTHKEIVKYVEGLVCPVYLVGGSVRDELMGVDPKDYDFTTPLPPDEIENRIRKAQRRPYLVGKKFGTLGVKVDGRMVEITTFRKEKYITGSRKPQVEFVNNITADLSRRDFTMNAIAKRGNRYIDPFGGSRDIEKQLIRAVGNPTSRFREDPLRLLRAARFASQLGFHVDAKTEDCAKKVNYKILGVSKERWVGEIDKLLLSYKPSRGLSFLDRTEVLNYILPELSVQVDYDQNNKWHNRDLWEHTLTALDAYSSVCDSLDIEVAWALLLHDIAKPFVRVHKLDRSTYVHHEALGKEFVLKLGTYLRWSNKRIKSVSDLVLNHLMDDSVLRKYDNFAK